MKKYYSRSPARGNAPFSKARRIVMGSLLMSTTLLPLACGRDDDPNAQSAADLNRVDTTRIDVTLNNDGDPQAALLDAWTGVQVAAINPPTVGGLTVQATDVFIAPLAVYISYNYGGDTYAGAIDVFSLANILTLSLTASLPLAGTDINGIAVQGSNIYAVGASSTAGGAILKKIPLVGIVPTLPSTDITLTSFAGTDIAATASNLYVTSGDGGAFSVINPTTLAVTKSTSLTDARGVGLSAAGIPYVVSGQPGRVSVASAAGDIGSTYALGYAATAQSRSNIYVGSTWSVASLGEGGFSVFCNSTGAVIAHVAQATVAGIAAAKTVTNGVASANGLIYTANGEGGVIVYTVRDVFGSTGPCYAGTVTKLGSMNFGANLSANGVYADSLNEVFVATGSGGLRVLTTVPVALGLTSKL